MTKITAEFEMKCWKAGDGAEYAGARPWQVKLVARPHYHRGGTIDQVMVEAVCPDGTKREVWIEIADGDLVVHCYDADHDEPLNVRIGAESITTDNNRDGEGITHD